MLISNKNIKKDGNLYMKKHKRKIAAAGAVILLLLYISTLIFAFMDSPLATQLLGISVSATIILPIIFYAIILVHRLIHKNDD